MRCAVFSALRSVQCDAFTLSLLCDSVQHHWEAGVRNDRFLSIRTLADVPWQGRLVGVNAGRLQVELKNAWRLLGDVDIEALAISDRTQSIIEAPSASGVVERVPILFEQRAQNSRVSPPARLLGDVFAPLVSELLWMAGEVPAQSRIMVRCTAFAPIHHQR